jgi:hypothetical protein
VGPDGTARLSDDALQKERQERQDLDLDQRQGNQEELAVLERAAEQFDEQTESDVGIEDVQINPQTGEAKLKPSAVEDELEQQVAEQLRNQAFGRFSGADTDSIESAIEDDISVNGDSVSVSDDLQETFERVRSTDPVAQADAQGAGQTDPVARADAEGPDAAGRDSPAEKRARRRAARKFRQKLSEDTGVPMGVIGALNLERGDEITVQETEGGFSAGLSEDFQQDAVRNAVRRELERQTGADLDDSDIVVEETEDGEFRGRLSESGEETVEIQNTPGAGLPIVGGITTTGTRVRRGIRGATDPFAETFRDVTPSKKDVLGFVGAAAPVAAAEPTPFGEIGLGTAAGGAIVGGAVVGTASGSIQGEDPEAQTTTELPISDPVTSEIDEPKQAPEERGELEPGEAVVQELEVPEDGDQRVAPEELGIDRESFQDGEIPVDGPEGTQITDDGDLIVPDGTGLVARAAEAQQKEKEEEKEEEEEDEDDEDDEDDEEESREEFLDRVSPDETVVIGEPAEGTESDESEQSGQEGLLKPPEQGQQEDDAEEDTQEEGDFDEEDVISEQGTVVDDAEPEDSRSERDERLFDEEETSVGTGGRSLIGSNGYGTLLGGGSPTIIGALIGDRQQESAQSESATAQTPRVGEATAALEGEQSAELSATASRTGALDLVGDLAGDQVGDLTGDLVADTETTTTPTTTTPTTTTPTTTTPTEIETPELETPAIQGTPGTPTRRVPRPRPDENEGNRDSSTRENRNREESVDGELTSGFLNEFAAQLAGVDRSAPSEGTLEEIAASRSTNQALPTEGELKEAEQFEEAAGFLSGEGTGFEFGFGDSDDDGGFTLL